MQAQQYLPSWMPTKWMRLFTQPWEGDVTIVMPWSLYARNISKAIHNPSQEDLVEADSLGCLGTWEHMSAIEVRDRLSRGSVRGARRPSRPPSSRPRGAARRHITSPNELGPRWRCGRAQGNCAIEMKLDQCLHRMAQAAAANGVSPEATPIEGAVVPALRPHHGGPHLKTDASSSSRIPSWLHLPQLPAFTARVQMSGQRAVSARPDAVAGARGVRALLESSRDHRTLAPRARDARASVRWPLDGSAPSIQALAHQALRGAADGAGGGVQPRDGDGRPLFVDAASVGAAAHGQRLADVAAARPPDTPPSPRPAGFTVASASSSSGEGLAGQGRPAARPTTSGDSGLRVQAGGACGADPGTSDDFWATILASRAGAVALVPGLRRAKPSSYSLDVIAP